MLEENALFEPAGYKHSKWMNILEIIIGIPWDTTLSEMAVLLKQNLSNGSSKNTPINLIEIDEGVSNRLLLGGVYFKKINDDRVNLDLVTKRKHLKLAFG